MAKQQGQLHRLPPLPPVANHRHRSLHHGRLLSRIRRRLLQEHHAHVDLPIRHVLRPRRPRRIHHLRLLGHRQRRRPPPFKQELLRLLPPGLLRLARGTRRQ
ncbi:hypothetical protein LINGRAPRIM_LOCUS1123 [Linum grandiflorum]